jgi:hypothetical protein
MGGSKALSYLTTSQFSILAKITLLCLISSDFREGGSEQISAVASISQKPPADDVCPTTNIRAIASNVEPSSAKFAIEEFEDPEIRLHRRPGCVTPGSRLCIARRRGTVSCCRRPSSDRRSHRQCSMPSHTRGCAGRRQ